MPKDYFARSRTPRYSLALALPLLLLYEIGAFALSGSLEYGVRNGADVLLKSLFLRVGGHYGVAAFSVVLLAVAAILVWRDIRRNGGRFEPGMLGWMLAEAAVYAAVFGVVVGWLTAAILGLPHLLAIQAGVPALGVGTRLVISLGAGIYEEILFRVVLTGGLLWAGQRLLHWKRGNAAATAVVLSALIFSAFHYVGSLGDTFTVASFMFRAIAGVAFSGLYVTRGLGVTAWTHALYDVGITLMGG